MGAAPPYTLRDADRTDIHFLFGVIVAIKQHSFDWGDDFREFKKKFRPEEIQVIRHQDRDIGRLRVGIREEKGKEADLYVGGIHLLPQYQERGIGSAIFAQQIIDSTFLNLPIRLEVHPRNLRAQRFYERFDFNIEGMIEFEKGWVWGLVRRPYR